MCRICYSAAQSDFDVSSNLNLDVGLIGGAVIHYFCSINLDFDVTKSAWQLALRFLDFTLFLFDVCLHFVASLTALREVMIK